MTKYTKIDVPVAQARMKDIQQRKRLKMPKRKATRGGNKARMGRGLRRLQDGFCMMKVLSEKVIRKNVKGKYGEAVSGGAGLDMAKDVNIVLDDDRQLLVLSVQNRERKFQEPPRWEGLARLSRVMNNLVGKTTGHHTTDGASFACGARKHFGTNSEGGTVTTYKPNTHGERLSPADLKAEQVPTVESIQKASEVIKNILGDKFWKNCNLEDLPDLGVVN